MKRVALALIIIVALLVVGGLLGFITVEVSYVAP